MNKEEESNEKSPEELKALGNEAVKNNKFSEAALHYSFAIKMDPNNFILYNNRSFAYLKMEMYYLALQDATQSIKLNPTGAKGYFRKAEVEYATKHFEDAIRSYEQALHHLPLPHDEIIKNALLRTSSVYMTDKRSHQQIPWVGSGIGIVIGAILMILDYIYTNKPTQPMLMVIVTMVISLIGYGIAKGYCYYDLSQRDSLLQPPPNLCDEDENPDEKVENSKGKKLNSKYTKSQARQRYKKGKN